MTASLLVGLDGSPYSEAAVELGVQWAQRIGASFDGLAIVDEPTICGGEAIAVGGSAFKARRDTAKLHEAEARVERLLARFLERCAAAGVAASALRKVGVPAEQILREAEDHDYNLLGRRTFFHFETQEGADETLDVVLRNSHRPVIAVPDKVPESKTVLIGYDATPPATRALEAFRRAGFFEGRPVKVLSVSRKQDEASRHAQEGASFLAFFGFQATPLPLTSSQPAAELILEQSKALAVGLLVLGAYGGSRIRNAFFGSTTQQVVAASDAVLLLHH
jgi:nucleotide-binding universal stress UspA family protein